MLVKDQVPIFYYGIYRLWTVNIVNDLKPISFYSFPVKYYIPSMKKASDKVKHYFDCEVVNTEYDNKNHVITLHINYEEN